MTPETLQLMIELLLACRQAGGGWGYHREGVFAAEPTALAALALDAVESTDAGTLTSVVESAAERLVALQQPDGSLGVTEKMPMPQWATAWGALLWNSRPSFHEAGKRAIHWLESHQGNTDLLSTGGPFSHNSTIPGWPWVLGTQSWLEPTALSVLALSGSSAADHPRARQGRELIRDRAIRTGGWNYGNSQVFGADLRAQPVPTGMALCALMSGSDRDLPCVDRACDFLERAIPRTRAPQSLAWGILGLTACGRRPVEADGWVGESLAKVAGRSDSAVSVALLLLAVVPHGLSRMGVATPMQEAAT